MNELALFAGAGGGILGGHLLGWRTVCAVEWEAYPASVLVARQNDKILPSFPIWDDVQTFDGKPWRGIVDVVSGGFPCQDISAAGGGLELTEKEVECGERWQGLLARLDPNTHLWKIPQCSLLEDSEQSLEIWPRWGTMQNGVCWEQPMLVQTIKETEFGLLPNNETFFHTPNTTGMDGGSNSRKALKKRMADTPSGNWPTPTCADIYTDKLKSTQQSENSMHSVSLGQAVQKYPTPVARMWKDMNCPAEHRRDSLPLAAIAGGALNPTWTEWLMGWPLEWTDLKPLEMDKSHFVQQQPGQS